MAERSAPTEGGDDIGQDGDAPGDRWLGQAGVTEDQAGIAGVGETVGAEAVDAQAPLACGRDHLGVVEVRWKPRGQVEAGRDAGGAQVGQPDAQCVVKPTSASLDGVINHMERWHFDYIDAESDSLALQQIRDSDALLMGRHTYDVYAGAWPGRDGDVADRINAMTKYVASTTLQSADWNNTTILDGDLIEAITRLKQDPDQDILMHGPVAKSLVRHGLLDELVLWGRGYYTKLYAALQRWLADSFPFENPYHSNSEVPDH